MYARVLTAQVQPDQLDNLIKAIMNSGLADAEAYPGFRGTYGLVDRSTGRGMLITLWESARDLEEVEASGILARTLSEIIGCLEGPAVRETYEVAIES
jgi:heme-degrading monooxygenase HmoA